MEHAVLKLVYTLFVGAMLALFVGFGIDTFYPEPEYPTSAEWPTKEEPSQAEMDAINAANEQYQEDMQSHSRTVSLIATGAAVVMLGVSLLLERRNRVLTNGIMLGGFFTLIYGVGRGFASGDTTATFITITVGLAVVIALGLRRFSHRRDLEETDRAQTPAPEKPAT